MNLAEEEAEERYSEDYLFGSAITVRQPQVDRRKKKPHHDKEEEKGKRLVSRASSSTSLSPHLLLCSL